MSTIGFNRPTGNESTAELADMVASMQKVVEHLSRNINSKNVTEIGGWLVDADRLSSLDGDVGLSSAYTGVDDVRLWSGSVVPETAPWRVLNSGKMYATGAEIASSAGWPKVTMDPNSDLFGAYASPSDFIQIFTRNYYPYLLFTSGGAYSTYMYQLSNGFHINTGDSLYLTSSYGEVIASNLKVDDWTKIRTPSTNLYTVLTNQDSLISSLDTSLGSAFTYIYYLQGQVNDLWEAVGS